jgi:hypothetical protein
VDGITGEDEDQKRDEAEHPSWCAHSWPHPGRDCSGAHRRDCGCKTGAPGPWHLSLGELIARLRQEPDQARRIKVGFDNPHSYRGYYMDVAFELAQDVSIGQMLAAAESALGATFQGWKGGDYTMSKYTDTWLVEREGCVGETIGAVLLDFLLQDPESAYRAGREDAARAIEDQKPADVLIPLRILQWAAEIARGDGVQPTEEQRTGNEDQKRDEGGA